MDKITLPKVIALVKDFLQKVNVESGKTENRFNLLQLDQQLVFRHGEYVVRPIYYILLFSFLTIVMPLPGLTAKRRRP